MPGTIEGTGTYFEVTDSNYLNITFESSEPVHLRLESIPEMVMMEIEDVNDANWTDITIGGFEPSTTYYKYQDDYHNLTEFTTNESGSYTYTQDLTERHLVFIQPRASTIFLSASGWSDPTVGTWDATTQTGTLTQDVYEAIQIDSDGITLDGAGHTVTGSGTGYGVYLTYKTGSTIKNVNIQQFSYGIYGRYSSNNILTANTASGLDGSGIYLHVSSGNTLTGNTLSANGFGIRLEYFSNSTVTGNTASGNTYTGILISRSSNNSLTNNTASNNSVGIDLRRGDNNTLTGNTASNNSWGIYLEACSATALIDNTANSNNELGISLWNCWSSTLTGNIMSGNSGNFGIYGGNFDHEIDITNTVDGKPIYYVKDAVGEVYDSSTNAGVFYAINCDNITIKDLTLNNNFIGVFLWKTHNSSIESVTTSSNWRYGIYLRESTTNTLTDNTTSNNGYYGIGLETSSNSTVTGNTVSNNGLYGIYIRDSSDNNVIYNNNILYNRTQACIYRSSGNVFNLDKPTGGNYWSNWTSPDNNGDGFVDYPYVFARGQDDLPWVHQNGWLNQMPVANAGADQSVHPGDVVNLDGSASTDPDENYPLTYTWQITGTPEGSATELWDADTVSPTFIPDLMGDYTIELVVTDSLGGQSAPASVVISTYNTAPVADAGEDQALLELYITVQLGTDPSRQSYDEDGDPITYLWTITTKPEGSAATLDDPTLATPTFEADIYGDYVISLVVKDDFDAVSLPDVMTVSFTNVQPVADAGGNQAVVVGDTVLLDGSGSYDINADQLTYSWSLVSKPEGSVAEIANPTLVQTSFAADQLGTYVVSLIVNDGLLDSDADNVTIEVITIRDALVQTLLDLIDVVNALDPSSLKNVNMMKNPLTNKINAVLNKIDRGFYDEALQDRQRVL